MQAKHTGIAHYILACEFYFTFTRCVVYIVLPRVKIVCQQAFWSMN